MELSTAFTEAVSLPVCLDISWLTVSTYIGTDRGSIDLQPCPTALEHPGRKIAYVT